MLLLRCQLRVLSARSCADAGAVLSGLVTLSCCCSDASCECYQPVAVQMPVQSFPDWLHFRVVAPMPAASAISPQPCRCRCSPFRIGYTFVLLLRCQLRVLSARSCADAGAVLSGWVTLSCCCSDASCECYQPTAVQMPVQSFPDWLHFRVIAPMPVASAISP